MQPVIFMESPNDLLLSTGIGDIGCLPYQLVNFMLQRTAIQQIITLHLYMEGLVENLAGGCRDEKEVTPASSRASRCGLNNHRGQEIDPYGMRNLARLLQGSEVGRVKVHKETRNVGQVNGIA